jgi:hypothetical protein
MKIIEKNKNIKEKSIKMKENSSDKKIKEW